MTKTQAETVGDVAAEVRAEIARRMPKKPRTEFGAELGMSPKAWDDRISGEVEWRITELMALARILGVQMILPEFSVISVPDAESVSA